MNTRIEYYAVVCLVLAHTVNILAGPTTSDSPSTTTATTTTTPIPPPPGFECPMGNITNSIMLFTYTGDCTLYIQCIWTGQGNVGAPRVMPCPTGLWWNDDPKQCDWPSNVKRTDCKTKGSERRV